MEKLNGKKKLRVSVFISGRGTNLKSLINFSKRKSSPIKIVLIITNNKNAKGIYFAKKNKIKSLFINYKNKNNAESKILINLKSHNINFICLAGFMKILSKKIINIYKNRILNIHPSLLPKYKGLNTFENVLKNKDTKTGCTIHYVNEKLDAGKVIVQKRFYVDRKDNIFTLKKKTQSLEYLAYPEAVIKIFRGC